MSWGDHSNSEQGLDPWRVIVGYLFELDSYKIPGIIDKSGMAVEWNLTERQDYSDKYQKGAYRPRIDKAFKALSDDDRLRVAYIVVEQLHQNDLAEELNTALNKIGWKLEDGKLAPANAQVQELFFPPTSQHDAYVRIRGIFQRAKQSLCVIDPYLDATIFQALGDVRGPLEIKLLTGKPPNDFRLEAGKFEQQYQVKIEIRRSRNFHDRFIIVDKKECWHIGCSIKDAGEKSFMMSRLKDEKNSGLLLNTQNESWDKATLVG